MTSARSTASTSSRWPTSRGGRFPSDSQRQGAERTPDSDRHPQAGPRPAAGSRPRDRAPGSQAGQHHGRQAGRADHHGFRPGPQSARKEGEASLTHSGAILGSPAYMSPEQIEGDPDSVGPASDQYSLGVVLYEMLTGQLPFRGSVVNVLAQIITKGPTPPSELRPGLDPRIEAVCLRMMSKKAVGPLPVDEGGRRGVGGNREKPGRRRRSRCTKSRRQPAGRPRRGSIERRCRRIADSQIRQTESVDRERCDIAGGVGPQMPAGAATTTR